MDSFIKKISFYPNGTSLLIELSNGLKIRGTIDTIYETDNGLEMDQPNYLEYYACSIEIQSIINHPKKIDRNIKRGNLIEVSILDKPLSVSLDDGTIIWCSTRVN